MSFINPAERGKWASLDAMVQFGWSGSSFIGGFVIEAYGYSLALLIVCIGQFFATTTRFSIYPFENSKADVANCQVNNGSFIQKNSTQSEESFLDKN